MELEKSATNVPQAYSWGTVGARRTSVRLRAAREYKRCPTMQVRLYCNIANTSSTYSCTSTESIQRAYYTVLGYRDTVEIGGEKRIVMRRYMYANNYS